MHYLTNYYKNLCEDLERKIQNLLYILEDAEGGRGWEKLKKHFGEMRQDQFDDLLRSDPGIAERAKAAREAWKKEAAERTSSSSQSRAEEPRSGQSSYEREAGWNAAQEEEWRRTQEEWERRDQEEQRRRNAEEQRRQEEARAARQRRGEEYERRAQETGREYNANQAWEEDRFNRERAANQTYEERVRRDYEEQERARANSAGAKVSKVVDKLKVMARGRGGRMAGGAALAVPIAIGVGKVGSMIGDLFANDINPKNPDLNSPGYSNINQYPKLSDIRQDNLLKGMKDSTDMDRINTYDMVRSAEEREKQRQLEKIEREGSVPEDEAIPSITDDEWMAAHEKYIKRRVAETQVPEPTKERMEPVSPYPFYKRD